MEKDVKDLFVKIDLMGVYVLWEYLCFYFKFIFCIYVYCSFGKFLMLVFLYVFLIFLYLIVSFKSKNV